MLTKQHLPIYGDTTIVVPPQGGYVELPKVAPTKRTFPIEHKTETPRFNDMRVNPGVKINETPKRDNSYHNGYASSESVLDLQRGKEGTINNWFNPAIEFRKQ